MTPKWPLLVLNDHESVQAIFAIPYNKENCLNWKGSGLCPQSLEYHLLPPPPNSQFQQFYFKKTYF